MGMQRRILLINPWIYDFTAYDFWMMPLGLLYVASRLRETGHFHIDCIDCLDRSGAAFSGRLKTKADGRGPFFKEEVVKPEVLKDIPRRYSRYGIPLDAFRDRLKNLEVPDVVLVTCLMTYWYPGARHVVELIRKRFGGVPVVLGGVYPSLMPEHARSQTGVDVVVSGPGEDKIFTILHDLLGLSFPEKDPEQCRSEMPRADFSLFPQRTFFPVLTSRGCPFDCSFCAGPQLYPGFFQRPFEDVVDEIESGWQEYGMRNFVFYDDSLLLNKSRHIVPILEEIIRKDLRLRFHTPNGLHVREIDAETAVLFRKAGMRTLYLSQESVKEEVLKASCPKVDPGDLSRAVGYLSEAGYNPEELNAYLIVGIPGQDASGIRESIERVQSLGVRPRLAFFSPVPKTRDWEDLVRRGIMKDDADPLLHNKLVFPYVWGNISPEEFEFLCRKAGGT